MQPWVPPLAPTLPPSSWKSLRSKPLALPRTSHLWLRFFDDIFVIQKAEHSQQLLQHSNTQDQNIQLTVQEPNQDGSLPFLDTKVTPGPNNTLITTIYRKPAHTDQYLHWDSNLFIAAKHSVYNTLAHRAKVISSSQPSLLKELDHIKMALQSCHFPTWALNKLQHNFDWRHYINNESSSTDSQHNNNHNNNWTSNNNNNNKNLCIGVPCIQGLGEKFKRTCSKKGIQIHFKGLNTIKTLLMTPKEKDIKLQKSVVTYKFKCPQSNCPQEYVKDSGWEFGDGLKENLRAPSPIHQQTSCTGHPISPHCFIIVQGRHKAQ